MTEARTAGRRRYFLLGCAWAAFAVYGSLVPLHYRPIAFGEAVARLRNLPPLWAGIGSRADWVANILLFIPLTFFWMGALTSGRRVGPRILASVALIALASAASLALEFTQIWFPGRTVSRNDILAESIGGCLGVAAWWAVGGALTTWLNALTSHGPHRSALRRALEAYLVGFVFFELMPLDLTVSVTDLAHKLREGRVIFLPFSYGYTDTVSTVSRLLGHTMFWLPVGAWIAAANPFASRQRQPFVRGLVGTGLIAACLEMAQLFVLSRLTDTTDVVLGAAGGGIGAWLLFHVDRRSVAAPASGSDHSATGAVAPVRVPRWWCAALAASTMAFAVYISLVPFRFVRSGQGLSVWNVLRPALHGHLAMNSGSNFVANSIMFVPIGLFGLAALVDASSRWWRWLLAATAVLLLSIVLSVAIETAQAFVPGRTPSLADVLAQAMGTTGGLAAWFVLSRPVSAFLLSLAAGQRRALEIGLGLYAAVQVMLLLEPFTLVRGVDDLVRKVRAGQIVWNPFQSSALGPEVVTTVLAAGMFAVPVGVLCALVGRPAGFRRPIPIAIATGAIGYLTIEVAQAFINGRNADIVDAAANILGVGAGVLLAAAFTSVSLDAPLRWTRLWAVVCLVVAAVLYAGYNLAPFDFSFSRQMFDARAGSLLDVPFSGYYENPEFKALREVFVKLALGLPFGLVFERGFPSRSVSGRRGRQGVWLAMTAVFFSACEVGQVFLPTRYPDNTDVIIATTAAWIGLQAARTFGREHR